MVRQTTDLLSDLLTDLITDLLKVTEKQLVAVVRQTTDLLADLLTDLITDLLKVIGAPEIRPTRGRKLTIRLFRVGSTHLLTYFLTYLREVGSLRFGYFV